MRVQHVGSILCVLVISAGTQALAQETAPRPPGRITVVGKGEVKRKPDLVTLSVGIVARDPDLSKARQNAAAKMTAALRVLAKAGVKRDEIETSEFSVYKTWDPSAGPIRRGKHAGQIVFQVGNTLTVYTGQVNRVGAMVDAVLKAGLNKAFGPYFALKDETTARREALDAAYKDAEAKAQRLANLSVTYLAQPVPVRAVRIVEEGAEEQPEYPGSPPMPGGYTAYNARPANADLREAAYETPLRSGLITVSAGVSVTFEVAR